MLQKTFKFIGKHKIAIGITIVLLIIGVYFGYKKLINNKKEETRYVLGRVEKGTLTASVSGSGQISEAETIDIKSPSSGTISEVKVQKGQMVKKDDVLIILDQKDTQASLNQAKASLKSARANYDKILTGATSEEIAVVQAQVKAAETGLDNAKDNYQEVVKQQKVAVSNAYAVLLNSGISGTGSTGSNGGSNVGSTSNTIPHSTNTSTATVLVTGSYSSTKTGTYIITLHVSNGSYSYTITGLEKAQGSFTPGILQLFGKNGLYLLISGTGTIVDGDSFTLTIPNTLASNYLNNYNAYQTAAQAQKTALVNAENNIKTAQNSLDQAKISLEQKQVEAKPADLAAAEAQIAAAKTQVQTAQDNYNNTTIKAPFDGVITDLNVKSGDQLGLSSNSTSSSATSSTSSSNTSSTAMLTLSTKEKVATISLNEVDITKIKTEQKVTLTFDAVEDLSITGKVIEVDSSGTISQGVVSYNAKVSLDTPDDRIKPGMSVSASIITDSKVDTLFVPSAAVKASGDIHYVEIPDEEVANSELDNSNGIILKKSSKQQQVEIGLISDSSTEIISGLKEGDKIISKTITSSTTKSQSSQNQNLFQMPGAGRSSGTRSSGMSGMAIPRD